MTTDSRRERARPMSPDVRRQAIVAATHPLLLEHGRATTTRQIADAAGIAEGTVFRVFDSKDELFDAVLTEAFEPGPFFAELAAIDLDQPLRARMLDLAATMQRRFVGIFELLIAMALPGPPPRLAGKGSADTADTADTADEWRRESQRLMLAVLEPDAGRFRLPLEEVVRTLRLLTFSGSHPHVSEQRPMSPDQIVDVVLHGTLAPTAPAPAADPSPHPKDPS